MSTRLYHRVTVDTNLLVTQVLQLRPQLCLCGLHTLQRGTVAMQLSHLLCHSLACRVLLRHLGKASAALSQVCAQLGCLSLLRLCLCQVCAACCKPQLQLVKQSVLGIMLALGGALQSHGAGGDEGVCFLGGALLPVQGHRQQPCGGLHKTVCVH